MDTYGWLSVLPPIVAIGLAIKTKQVYLSLGLFILLGWTIMSDWNPLLGMVRSVDQFLASVTDADNARVLLFSALVGAMITFTQASGGMNGFVHWVDRLGLTRSKRSVSMMTVAVSMAVFLESNFGLLVSGSVARPLFDKCRISREKLSYIIDATCAPKCILIGSLLPLNAWGAYVITLLAAEGVANPLGLLMSTVALNFYSLLAIILALLLIISQRDYGPMREAERRVSEEGKLLRDGARPMVADDVAMANAKEGIPERARNMIVPIAVMIGMVPIVLYISGKHALETQGVSGTFFDAITEGSGSTAVLWGVIIGLLTGAVSYRIQGIMNVEETTEQLIKGIQGLVPLVIVLSLAFTIGATTRALGTGVFIAQAAEATLNVGFIPVLVFLLACFVAFSTGTSWGTFGIMIPIVIPMIDILGLHGGLTIAAALSGGIFGDHCSPISDSTIVASMASATDHIDHVRTQLPYALTAAAGASALFLIFGFVL